MSKKINYKEVMIRMKMDVNYIAEEAYNKGYEEAKMIWSSKTDEESYKRGLHDGRNEAWEAARKVVLSPDEGGTSLLDLVAIFDDGSIQRVFRNYSSSEAIAKLKAYEEKQKEDEDGKDCKGCQWEGNESDFYPCSKCCNSYKNRYERKE